MEPHSIDAQDYKTKERIALYNGRKATRRLQILIVGCGIGGLAAAHALGQAGHTITVLESSPSIGDVGAGIQVGPNLSRILLKWGLAEKLKSIAGNDKPTWFTFRRYDTGKIIGMSRLKDKLDHEHGAPWYTVHRADLYEMLYSIASPFMNVRLNSRVVAVNATAQDRPSVVLQTGETISADLIIGADGIGSVTRSLVIGQTGIPLTTPTGDVAYRVLLPTHTFLGDPQLEALIEEPRITCWIGPGRHIVGYCIRNRTQYNMVFIEPGDGQEYSWTSDGDPDEMRAGFTGWDQRLQKLMSRAESVLKSKLVINGPLKTWIHESGRVALLGDACHPMLPYRAQGAAMAIEDAAVLGNLFSRISDSTQIPGLLRAYEELRHSRTYATQTASALNRSVYHMRDGAEQQKRDAAMQSAMAEELVSYERARDDQNLFVSHWNRDNPNAWSDKGKNAEQFDYDPDIAVDNWWPSTGVEIIRCKL